MGNKGLEAFENIRTQIRYPKGKRPERSKEELLNDLNIVEKELKALDIIRKSKANDDIEFIVWKKNTPRGFKYYCFGKQITQEEYNILREVLL